MELWAKEVLRRLERAKAQILFSEHAAKDKNLNAEDVNHAVQTVRIGKVDEGKSDQENERICFKNYFAENGKTYFAVVAYYPDFIKIITVIKKKGKY